MNTLGLHTVGLSLSFQTFLNKFEIIVIRVILWVKHICCCYSLARRRCFTEAGQPRQKHRPAVSQLQQVRWRYLLRVNSNAGVHVTVAQRCQQTQRPCATVNLMAGSCLHAISCWMSTSHLTIKILWNPL